MLSNIAKASLVSTAFAPVLLTLAFRYWREGDMLMAVWAITLATEFCILCVLILYTAGKELQRTPITVTSVKTADTEIVGFVIAYLLPLVNIDSRNVDVEVLIFVLMLLLVVVWATHTYHVNPLLAVFGYHFYEVTDIGKVTHILITRRTLLDSKTIRETVQLTDYMLLDLKNK